MTVPDDAVRAGADTLALGDTIAFSGTHWLVTAFHGPRIFLTAPGDTTAEPLIILQPVLTSAKDFAVLSREAPRTVVAHRGHELKALPAALRREVIRWERIVKEVLH
ncbi:hypothetical protein [Streptomyces sp. NBC_01089]|uniref:hypothetical protein n=1 Tax=Streptomyces sp. NBC_01089 TaxID=2903747 RepID=UPI0038671939|nr:hypothetical protein OG510_00185 [Streptomyces sp. NBC_01089]WSU46397.1 hypothetical protein OG510_36965 [Streptomyces sp. NBC_01089]